MICAAVFMPMFSISNRDSRVAPDKSAVVRAPMLSRQLIARTDSPSSRTGMSGRRGGVNLVVGLGLETTSAVPSPARMRAVSANISSTLFAPMFRMSGHASGG